MDLKPAALHGERSNLEPHPRKITIESNIMNQIDRIGYIRSVGGDWSEPLFHLRDLIVGLEDDEFWTGIPKNVDASKLCKEDLEEYRRRGWLKVPMRQTCRKTRNGKIIRTPNPTPSELAVMLRIIMALLARRGMTWRSKSYDEIPDDFEGEEE